MIKNLSIKYSRFKNKFDAQAFSIASHRIFEKNDLYEYFYKNKNLITILKKFLGNDIVLINFSRFQINLKKDKNINLKKIRDEKKFQQFKGIHNDHCTGSSEFSLHC